MSTPYVGEIRMFAGNFAPANWAFCNGQILPISENETLFNLIGTTYGGDGESTFALPDLRSRLPVHQDTNFILAEMGGIEQVTLTPSHIPAHTHPMHASTAPGGDLAGGNAVLAQGDSVTLLRVGAATVPLAAASVAAVGGSQPHTNLQPYLCVNFIISLFGIYPSPT